MKNKIIHELSNYTKKLAIEEREEFTAIYYAQKYSLSRNTVSQYLNEAVGKGELVKVNSRPVYFFSKSELVDRFKKLCDIDVFSSFEELNAFFMKKADDFEELIGYDKSLRSVVEHCKAAVSYPTNGLPILIHGATGTGKSMIASLMYKYAVNQNIIDSKKKFVSVNCSEYANNPELLLSNLFGHVKGAFTGADSDSQGLISLADGGLLFLDEVHCLKAECQEKLFFFMDKGIYHKMGDNENWFTSNTRIVFATTEDPQAVLLKTLLRRIPITVTVPSLEERPLVEKRRLIASIFVNESLRLKRKIEISNLVYQTLMDYKFVGNIGEMKNVIKATCANAFLNHSKKQQEVLAIHVHNLPSYVVKPLTSVQTKIEESGVHMLPVEQLNEIHASNSTLFHFYGKILKDFSKYVNNEMNYSTFISGYIDSLQTYIDYAVYQSRYNINVSNDYVLKIMDKIYSIVMNKYSFKIPNNDIKIYSQIIGEYSKAIMDSKIWYSSHCTQVEELLEIFQSKHPREYAVACEIMENIQINLDIELDKMFLSMLVVSVITFEKKSTSGGVGVILCHGYSTASSLAATVNRLLNEYIFDGIDMQIDISIDKIAIMVDEYLKQRQYIDELILLVDMGSLEEIYKRIKPVAKCNIALMNNVSTRMGLEVGMAIQQGKSVREILDDAQRHFQLTTHYIEGREKQEVIVSVCATGFGSAKKISELLESSLQHKAPIKVIPYEYHLLAENGIKDSVFMKYDVKLIVGTLDPKVDGMTFIPVEGLIMNEGLEILNEVVSKHLSANELEVFHQNMMKNFTLSNMINHLTILNAEKIIDDVEEIVNELEECFDRRLDLTRKAGLYVHLSCLIERLILKNEIVSADLGDFVERHQAEIAAVYEAFSGVCMRYSVELPEAEAAYVLNYFENT